MDTITRRLSSRAPRYQAPAFANTQTAVELGEITVHGFDVSDFALFSTRVCALRAQNNRRQGLQSGRAIAVADAATI